MAAWEHQHVAGAEELNRLTGELQTGLTAKLLAAPFNNQAADDRPGSGAGLLTPEY